MESDRYLKGLNEGQKEAVLHTEGPLLIVAGAGAGKTKTITHRIAHLMGRGVQGRNILAVTFTNKAAGEMRERVRQLLSGLPAASWIPARAVRASGQAGSRTDFPLLITFHSLGARILREFHHAAGIPKSFTIWDRDDSLKALKAILLELGSDLSPKSVLSAISRAKGDGISGAEYAESANNNWKRSVVRAWDRYDKVLREEAALDFDDLLLSTIVLLRSSPEILSLLQSRWSYLTIDEYQDTNRAQYEIARLLAAPQNNICAVADGDQTIYTWRGATIENFLLFEKQFPGTKIVTLEQNYRSTRTILAAANAIIEKNVRRKPKNLFTQNETGEPILFYGAMNEIDEAWFVAQSAANLIKSGTSPQNIAVLYRENFQSRVLEEAFLHLSVPYRVLGTRFFERKEVKDTLAYLRAALNPQGRSDIARIIASPPRGIGKITLEKMLSNDEADIPKAARAKVESFRETLNAIRSAALTVVSSEAVRFAIEASGIQRMLSARGGSALGGKKDDDESRERLANVYELVNLSTKYDDELPPAGIEKLLEDAALQSEQDELGENSSREKNAESASLMTVHASKGLEFDAVFVTGLEGGLFPSERVSDTERDPEEERRLFYVAITRAAKRLFLSCAHERMKYGSREYTTPSEFLDDIDPRLIESAQGAPAVEEEIIE